jgi:S-adenosylmethionine hydrolase
MPVPKPNPVGTPPAPVRPPFRPRPAGLTGPFELLKMRECAMEAPLIALLTDFGNADYFVGSLKGVIAAINPRAVTVDISHEVPAFDRLAGGFILNACFRFFPKGSIFLAVVDPGVAGPRKIILVRTLSYDFIAPDNGLLTLPLSRESIVEVRHVASPRFFLTPGRTTFEGRDRMAPAAAWLSLGAAPSEFGPPLKRYQRLAMPKPVRTAAGVRGVVLHVDAFGNLITNIPGRWLNALRGREGAGEPAVVLGGRAIRRFARSYAAAKRGGLVVLVNSLGLVEVAAREASAAAATGIGRGDAVALSGKGRP